MTSMITPIVTVNKVQLRQFGGDHHGHGAQTGAGPSHPVVPGSVGNRFEDRYWPSHDNVYRPPTIQRDTHYSMDHDLFFDDGVRPEPLVDNHNLGLSKWRLLAQLGVGAASIVAAYYAAKFYSTATGPSYMWPRRLPYDGLREEQGGMDDRNWGHGEPTSSSTAMGWFTRRHGDPYLAPGEEAQLQKFVDERRAQAASRLPRQ